MARALSSRRLWLQVNAAVWACLWVTCLSQTWARTGAARPASPDLVPKDPKCPLPANRGWKRGIDQYVDRPVFLYSMWLLMRGINYTANASENAKVHIKVRLINAGATFSYWRSPVVVRQAQKVYYTLSKNTSTYNIFDFSHQSIEDPSGWPSRQKPSTCR